MGDNGETVVQELEEIKDSTNETILKNVAIGTGVILVCVTVTYLAPEAAMPTVHMIFTSAAKGASKMSLSSATVGALSAAIVRGYETGDMYEALNAALMGASEGFKWGAITGAIEGVLHKTFELHGMTKSGLSMKEAAKIQSESKFPKDVISQIKSMDEYNLYYKEVGLKAIKVNGKTALIQPKIDLEYVSELADGSKVTNLTRMQKGLAPIEPATGKPHQLHHIGQKADGSLAVLTEAQHQGNARILNQAGKASEINRPGFANERKQFWQTMAEILAG